MPQSIDKYFVFFRMVVGEDKNKVSNIVRSVGQQKQHKLNQYFRPQLHRFRELYSEALSEFGDNLHVDSKGRYEQHDSAEIRRKYVTRSANDSKEES